MTYISWIYAFSFVNRLYVTQNTQKVMYFVLMKKKTAYNWKIDIYRKKISKSIRAREREEGWGEKESEKGMEGAA